MKPVLHYESEDLNSANPTTSSNSSSGFKTELGFDGRPVFEASALKLPFIEEALAAGANLHHISFQHHNSDWTVVSFTNAKGTYLVNGDDVYVTQASVQQAQAAIERDPATLRGIRDLGLAGDIEISVSEVRSTENRIEPRSRVVEHSLSM